EAHFRQATGDDMTTDRRVDVARASVATVAALATLCGLGACDGQARIQPQAETPPADPPATIHAQTWPAVRPPTIDDAPIAARLEALLAALSVEEKVGQVIQADIASVTPEDVRKYRLGSVLNGGNSGPHGNDFAPAPEWLRLADEFYQASMDTAGGKHAIPIVWGVDAIHGNSNII